jgi:hypothetical protein
MMEMNWIKGEDGRLTIKWTEVRNTPSRLMARNLLGAETDSAVDTARKRPSISIGFTRPARLASANRI